MDILVVGGGGREHAIVMKLAESPKVGKLYCTPGNGGISRYAECFDVTATDIEGVVALAKKLKVDMVAVAPDDPLVLGMVDALQAEGFKFLTLRQNNALAKCKSVSLYNSRVCVLFLDIFYSVLTVCEHLVFGCRNIVFLHKILRKDL